MRLTLPIMMVFTTAVFFTGSCRPPVSPNGETGGQGGPGAEQCRTLPKLSGDAKKWVGGAAPVHNTGKNAPARLIFVWTFGCYNCTNSIPWVKAVTKKYSGKKFEVVGIHSPEFSYEKSVSAVSAAHKKYGLKFASFIDNDMTYWRSLKNRYWPAFYFVDSGGCIQSLMVGEIHSNTSRGKQAEAIIDGLLKKAQ